MFGLTKLISAMMLPPFNIILLSFIGLVLILRGHKKWGGFFSIFSLSLLYLCSLPYTAERLSDSLTKEDHLSLDDYKNAQAIVLLGGGLRDSKELYSSLTVPQIPLERMRYASYLQQHTQLPLLITGASPNGNSEAKIMAQEMQQFFHTPVKWQEDQAKTTKENAIYTAKILQAEHIQKIILVTNQWHMQRAKLLFERQGFQVLPASVGAGLIPESYGLNLMHFIPQAGALNANMQLLKEWVGYWKEKYSDNVK